MNDHTIADMSTTIDTIIKELCNRAAANVEKNTPKNEGWGVKQVGEEAQRLGAEITGLKMPDHPIWMNNDGDWVSYWDCKTPYEGPIYWTYVDRGEMVGLGRYSRP